jgi:hypothetical protein
MRTIEQIKMEQAFLQNLRTIISGKQLELLMEWSNHPDANPVEAYCFKRSIDRSLPPLPCPPGWQ